VSRWAAAEVDLGAIAHNTRLIRSTVAPADVWAVVKADGYGHGAVAAARSALGAGAAGLCVALVQEGLELRAAGIEAPIHVLSEQPRDQIGDAVAAGLVLTVYSVAAVEAVESTGAVGHPVQVKVDTGMRRVGCAPVDAVSLAQRITSSAACRLDGTFTHLAVADDIANPFTAQQLERFEEVLGALRTAGVDPGVVHVANSAGGLAHPAARYDRVRAGISLYGVSPGGGIDPGLRPAMRLTARVSHVKRVSAGDGISYGLRHVFEQDTTVATVPIGYADGVPRRWGRGGQCVGGDVLVGGERRPIVGVVTMDQLMVDVGALEVAIGDEVVLIGRQGDAELRVEEIADRLDTIGYELVCGVSKRIARHHVS
jgi:alanine racemase